MTSGTVNYLGILATSTGTIALAKLVRATRYSWHLIFEDKPGEVRISKKDPDYKFFRDVDTAISWINTVNT